MALSYQEIVYTQWPTYADPGFRVPFRVPFQVPAAHGICP